MVMVNILPALHMYIPLSIMKLITAIMIPNRARKTQSSPSLANVCFHRKDMDFASLPGKKSHKYFDQAFTN